MTMRECGIEPIDARSAQTGNPRLPPDAHERTGPRRPAPVEGHQGSTRRARAATPQQSRTRALDVSPRRVTRGASLRLPPFRAGRLVLGRAPTSGHLSPSPTTHSRCPRRVRLARGTEPPATARSCDPQPLSTQASVPESRCTTSPISTRPRGSSASNRSRTMRNSVGNSLHAMESRVEVLEACLAPVDGKEALLYVPAGEEYAASAVRP